MMLQLLDALEPQVQNQKPSVKDALLAKIENKQARIAIVGMGYVGLPLARRFVECGFTVVGFDSSAAKAVALNAGTSYIHHISNESVSWMCDRGFTASTDPSVLHMADCILICVPTPVDEHHQPDISYIESAMKTLKPQLRVGQFICLESTTYPGTTRDMAVKFLQDGLLTVGKKLFVGYSPEREDPGNGGFNTRNVPKICSGLTPGCLEICAQLFSQVVDHVVPVSTVEAAEMAKLLENSYRAVNIALANEFKKIADVLKIDILEVIDAAATKPFGFAAHYPGPGVGGHCIPVDPFYLLWKAQQAGISSALIETAMAINGAMPEWVVSKVLAALPARRCSAECHVLILGVTYKKNVDDTRGSPALQLIELLLQHQVAVDYCDPHASLSSNCERLTAAREVVQLNAATLEGYDAVVLAVDHDAFDYGLIGRHARRIIDTRGVYREGYATTNAVISA